MEINDALIDKLASLSRLHFTDTEKSKLTADFVKMVHFVDKLNELDTAGMAPLLHITSNVNNLREDIAANDFSLEDALKNASLKDEQFFKVPKVIRK